MSVWSDTPGRTYTSRFGDPRADPPKDLSQSPSLKDHGLHPNAKDTKTVKPLDIAALIHYIGAIRLDLTFVKDVLDTTGPKVGPQEYPEWNFGTVPRYAAAPATSEEGFYPWFEWALCAPAGNAVNAVRHKFHEQANSLPTEGFPDQSQTNVPSNPRVNGATDIMHWLVDLKDPAKTKPCTPHEFKRSAVLGWDSDSALNVLVASAAEPHGFQFRIKADLGPMLEKGRRVLVQTINEMIAYDTGHAIMCTQDQYVLLRLTPDYQLEISRVYQTRHSTRQASDMAELVLFYTHSALSAGTKFSQIRTTAIAPVTGLRVIVPSFPTHVFQPYEAVFRDHGLAHRTQLIALAKGPRSLFPLPWVHFDADTHSHILGHDVSISHGSILFLFLAARVVAKTAHGYPAIRRLRREFKAYAAMRDLQGAVIPKLVGFYRRKDDKSVVLLVTYAGTPLQNFGDLPDLDRRTLFRRLLRLHESGVQHNDFEPRNVTMFGSSNPVIIDFDNASLDHQCAGSTCGELVHVAKLLGIDIITELEARKQPQTNPNLPLIIAAALCVLLLLVWVPRRR
ncbi:hypothetical protein K438DRAFT_1955439 [Mycena galopus ATCC 62051]|nr:hypothetical protein K438DRAFT_1955439 [Mycena galopus ATCC 62051]